MQVVFKFSLRWCPQLLLLLNSAPEFLNLSSLICAKHHEYENRSCWNKTAWSSHAHNYSSEEQVASDELSPSHHWYCSAHPCKEQSIWIGDSVTTAHKELAQGSTEQKVQGEIPTGKRKQTNKQKNSLQAEVILLMPTRSLSLQGKCWNALRCYQLLSVHSSCPEQFNVVHSIKQKLYVRHIRGIKSEQEIHFAGKFIDFFHWSPVVLCCSFWWINSCFTEEIQLFRQTFVIV